MKKITIVLSMLFVVGLFSVTLISANDCTVNWTKAGMAVFPIDNDQVEMTKENLEISVTDLSGFTRSGYVDVNVEYEFTNTGEATKFQMGFPIEINTLAVEYYTASRFKEIFERKFRDVVQDFATWINGKEVKTELVYGTLNGTKMTDNIKDKEDVYIYYVFDVEFKENEKIRVQHKYRYWLTRGCPNYPAFIAYILTTGKHWKGPIREFNAKVSGIDKWYLAVKGWNSSNRSKHFDFNKNPEEKYNIVPSGYIISDNEISWSLKDYVPNDNLYVEFILKALCDFHDHTVVACDSIAELSDKQIKNEHRIGSMNFIRDIPNCVINIKKPYIDKGMYRPELIHKLLVTLKRLRKIFIDDLSGDTKIKLDQTISLLEKLDTYEYEEEELIKQPDVQKVKESGKKWWQFWKKGNK